jgi:protoheme IX farnesyltransferase
MIKLRKSLNTLKDLRNNALKDLIQLSKLPVIIPVSLTSFTAYFIASPKIGPNIIFVTLGVLLLAAAASALNQIQEIKTDQLMARTKMRPLADGRIQKSHVFIFVIILVAAGSHLLIHFGNITAFILGISNLIWYNGIYTPLKRKTAFAVIPGSLTGAIPPVIGWVAAGEFIFARTSILMAFMFFMAQVPHFWLLIMKYGEEYSEAGLPSLTKILGKEQIRRMTHIWILASLFSALILTQFGLDLQSIVKTIILLVTLLIAIIMSRMSPYKSRDYNKKHFILLNSYFMLVMVFLIIDKVIVF